MIQNTIRCFLPFFNRDRLVYFPIFPIEVNAGGTTACFQVIKETNFPILHVCINLGAFANWKRFMIRITK